MPAVYKIKPVSIRANDTAGLKNHAIPEGASLVHNGARVKVAIFANLNITTNETAGTNDRSDTNLCSSFNHSPR